MKIDRLLQIVICLLNNKSVTAKQMAQRFEVSAHTIQRDMESISLAGIPLVANAGSQGGYRLLPAYKLHNQFEKKERLSGGHYLMHLHVPPDERLWQALLLSLGDSVKILFPEGYRNTLIHTAQNSFPIMTYRCRNGCVKL